MSQMCSTCSRSDIEEIDAELDGGVSAYAIARKYDLNTASVYRHTAHRDHKALAVVLNTIEDEVTGSWSGVPQDALLIRMKTITDKFALAGQLAAQRRDPKLLLNALNAEFRAVSELRRLAGLEDPGEVRTQTTKAFVQAIQAAAGHISSTAERKDFLQAVSSQLAEVGIS